MTDPKPAEMPDEIYTLCHEAYEVYAGMEGGIPEAAYEGFLLQHIEEMAKIIGKAKSICLTRASATAGKAELEGLKALREVLDRVQRIRDGNDKEGYSVELWGSEYVALTALTTTSRLNATVGDGWRPIESCPKIHGKRFLGYHFEIGHFVAEWFVDSFVYTWNQHDCPITHWMPLPKGPNDEN